jgi:hypothetical protein
MFDENTQSFNIGNLFLMQAGVTQEQLSAALRVQQKHPDRKLGEILLEMGVLTRDALDAALKKQQGWRKDGPSAEDTKKMADFAISDTERINRDLDHVLGKFDK